MFIICVLLFVLIFLLFRFIFVVFFVVFLLSSCLPTGSSLLLWQQINCHYATKTISRQSNIICAFAESFFLSGSVFHLGQYKYRCEHTPICTKFIRLHLSIFVVNYCIICWRTDMLKFISWHVYNLSTKLYVHCHVLPLLAVFLWSFIKHVNSLCNPLL